MADIRKTAIIIVIAVLFTIFTQTTANAVFNDPDYEDFCGREVITPRVLNPDADCVPYEVPQEDRDACLAQKGEIRYEYSDVTGCADGHSCSTCFAELGKAEDAFAFKVFALSAILGLIALFLGLYLPGDKNPLHEWVGSGFMLGGLITIFTGTVRSFESFAPYVKPVVIGLELALIIWLTYKYLSGKQRDNTKD